MPLANAHERLRSLIAALAAASMAGTAGAQSITYEQIEPWIVDRNPQTRVDSVDHERLVVRRIDVVDENGVIRAVLSGKLPDPIVDGTQLRRSFPVGGLVLYDHTGSERGGLGTGELADGEVIALSVLDHANNDAIGWGTQPDGTVGLSMRQRNELVREPRLDNRLLVNPGPTRLNAMVAADGTPSLVMSDDAGRARLRLTVTGEGHGAIEFLDEDGEVIHTFAPGAEG